MIEIDFHGYQTQQALDYLDKIIGRSYINKEVKPYRFIVGHGQIKKEFLKILKYYEFEHSIELSNSGVIIAYIG